jgi:hypothetical protein
MELDAFIRGFEETLERPAGTTVGSLPLEQIKEWDSVSVVAFIAFADLSYGAAVGAEDIVNCHTVADLFETVSRRAG